MIINKNGHSNSLRTDKEELSMLQKELDSLTPEERETLQIMLQEVKDQEQGIAPGGLMNQMGRLEYKTTPVDMKTFVMDEYYLGHSCKTLYPKWLEALTELFEGGYQECIFGGAIGAGKTFAASIGICRTLYELSCMVNPHRSFGLGNDSNISIVALSVTEMLATKVVFENIVVKIDSSPYFRENFPFEKTKKELRFPNHIWVASRATTDSSALGLNAIGGLLDEASFMPKVAGSKANDPRFAGTDRAEVIYNAIKRRMKSRFEKFGRLPGILFIMSSKSTADDFVARRINESKHDPTIFCREFCLTGDTRVPLLSGETLSLRELSERHAGSDERFEVYSIDPVTQRIHPGRAHHPRLTLRNQKVLKISLDDGSHVRATPSHPFLLRNGEYRRAGELQPGDSLMPLYRRIDSRGYEELGQPHKDGEWIKTHRLVALRKYGAGGWPPRGSDGKRTVVHHVNHRKRNNTSDNLVWMEWTAHQKHHNDTMDVLLEHVKTAEHRAFASEHMKALHKKPAFAQARSERGAAAFTKMWADPVIREKLSAAAGPRLAAFHKTEKGRQRQTERNLKRWEGNRKVTRADIELAAEQGRDAADLAQELGCSASAISQVLKRTGGPSYLELKKQKHKSKPNHKVVAIEDAGFEDVYDLSVEVYENFGLEAGIFVHNSLWGVKKEAYFNTSKFQVLAGNEQVPSRILDPGDADKIRPTLPENCVIVDVPSDFRADFERDLEGCFSGDTLIPLLDGSEVAIKDLVGRDEFWVYSFGPDGRFYPGRGHSARWTKFAPELIEVELDDGSTVKCTPNHRFMCRDGSYLEAKDLKPGTSLMPLYRRVDRHGYSLLKSNMGGRWVHIHRLVAREVFREGARLDKDEVVHHKNFIRLDNSPDNLQVMTTADHQAYHKDNVKNLHTPESIRKSAETRRLKVASDPEFRAQLDRALAIGRASYAGSIKNIETGRKSGKLYGFGRAERTTAQKKAQSVNGTANITALNLSPNNPSKRLVNRQKSSKRLKATISRQPPGWITEVARKGQHSRWKHHGSFEECDICQQREVPKYLRVQRDSSNKYSYAAMLGCHSRWHGGDFDRCGRCAELRSRPRPVGNNHKVVSIKVCPGEDVYDISVDTLNNFALSAGVVVHNSLRDLAGVATLAISPFIQRREKILSAICKGKTPTHECPMCLPAASRKHPFSTVVYDSSKGGMFRWDMMVKITSTRMYGQRVEKILPILNPTTPRHIHVDPSYRRDSLGFCMAHVSGWRDVVRRNPDTQENYKERAPIYVVDFILRVVPPTGAEIILGDIRRMIYELTAHGYLITTVSMDSYQSVDGLQQLSQKGYNALDISVDTTPDPYDNLKTALYEDRLFYYEYPPLLEELRKLEQKWNAQKKRKIDHPPRGGKDAADALAGCLWTLSQNSPSSQPLAPLKGFSRISSDDSWLEEQRQAELAGNPFAGRNTALDDYGMLPPFLPSEPDKDPWGGNGSGGWPL